MSSVTILAALSSSRSPVVGPTVRPFVGWKTVVTVVIVTEVTVVIVKVVIVTVVIFTSISKNNFTPPHPCDVFRAAF